MVSGVLIEGIDRAGKSTLTKALKNRLGWDTRFLGHRQQDSQYMRFLSQYSENQCIFERGHISEAVYSQLFERPSPFTSQQTDTLNSILNTSFVVVYAKPDLDQAQQRYEDDAVNPTVSKQQLAVGAQIFDQWFAEHAYDRFIVYRSQNWQQLDAVVDQIESMVK